MGRPLVVIESHYAADGSYSISDNVQYAEACCRLAFQLGYHPFASHLFYPYFLNEEDPAERDAGIRLGYELIDDKVSEAWFCLRPGEDLSEGMERALEHYRNLDRKIVRKKVRFDGDINNFLVNVELVY